MGYDRGVVIVACPDCKTSHSKSDKELSGGAAILCRRCGKSFRVVGEGKTELTGPGGPVPQAQPAETSVMNASKLHSQLEAMKSPKLDELGDAFPDSDSGKSKKPAGAKQDATTAVGRAPLPKTPTGASSGPVGASSSAPKPSPLAASASAAKVPASPSPLAAADTKSTAPKGPAAPLAPTPSKAGAAPLPPSASGAAKSPVASPAPSIASLDPFAAAASGAGAPIAVGGAAKPLDLEASASASRPSRPDSTLVKDRDRGDFGDVPTDMIKATALKERLEQMRVAEEVAAAAAPQPSASEPEAPKSAASDASTRPVPSPDLAGVLMGEARPPKEFPWEPLRAFLTGLRDFLKDWPLSMKIAAVASLVLVLAGAVLLMVFLLQAPSKLAFVSDRQPLWVGPLAGETYTQLDAVERGQGVQVFDVVGEFAMVRDQLGRAGYVRVVALKPEAPPPVPGQPFVDCRRAPIEDSIERCQGRSQEQFEACRGACAGAAEASCLDHCQKRFNECMRTCEGELTSLREPVVAEPKAPEAGVAEGATPPAGAAGAAGSAAVEPETPEPETVAVEPPKKKVRKPLPKKRKK